MYELRPSEAVIPIHLLSTVIMIFRVYAMLGRNHFVAGFLLVLWVIQAVLWGLNIPLDPGR